MLADAESVIQLYKNIEELKSIQDLQRQGIQNLTDIVSQMHREMLTVRAEIEKLGGIVDTKPVASAPSEKANGNWDQEKWN